ncbi:MAG: CpaF family protein [Candidatus Omnitrophica bacterium]|nr:CpaF family protein [Candidatus Omnitrophota bacterium]
MEMEHSDLKQIVHQYLIKKTDFLKVKDSMNDDQLRVFVDKALTNLCNDERIDLPTSTRILLIRELVSAVVSLGPLRPLIEDKSITEIMINGPQSIYVQREGKITLTDIKFPANEQLVHTIQKILAGSGSNRRVDESSPYVDFSLPDGSRVNVLLPPCSLVGPVVTIRKFADINTLDDLLNRGMLSKKMAMLLIAGMKAKLNIVFCGATGTGKTTTLNVLSRHLPDHERIITIEDTPELRLMQKHVVSLQSKPANIEGKGAITIRDLFVNSLRMRPDRIIIGEIRSGEMLDMIESISSGHSGALAIVHAESPEDCVSRMVTMMLMTGIRLSTEVITKQVVRAIDLIVHIELFPDGVRRITHVSDFTFDDATHEPKLDHIFEFIQEKIEDDGKVKGHWNMSGHKPSFYKKFVKKNITFPEGFFESKVGD